MIIIGLESTQLSAADKRRLSHPACAGSILFARNYHDGQQLRALCRTIRDTVPDKLICTDWEGGRVQRFRGDFTDLPAMHAIGRLFRTRPMLAEQLAHDVGLIIAYELGRCEIDFSLMPVLDLYDEVATVIADRAFSANPAVVDALASALRRGLRSGGMAAVGKHYPGHGRVQGDSHHLLPYDDRPAQQREADIYPFAAQIRDGIEGIMTAHIVYPETDGLPGGFAAAIAHGLRVRGFDGAIMSDDLDMAGAQILPTAAARVQAALDAGADLTLICNDFAGIDDALAAAPSPRDPAALARRIARLRRKVPTDPAHVHSAYQAARSRLNQHSFSA